MKKTILAAALCCGLVAPALAATTYTLGSTTYTTTTGIANSPGNYNASQVTFTLTNDWFSGTQTTSNVLTTASDGSTAYASSTAPVALTSLSFLARNDSYKFNSITAIKILDSQGSIVASSSSYTDATIACHDIFISSTGLTNTWTRDVRTWTFTALNSVLNVGSSYTIKFYNESGVEGNLGTTACDSAATGYTSFAVQSTSYQPAGMEMTYTAAVAVVPEPATATLSLLALAGLAARRRRK